MATTTTKVTREYTITGWKNINLALDFLTEQRSKVKGFSFSVSDFSQDSTMQVTATAPKHAVSNLDKAMGFIQDCGVLVSYELICHDMGEYNAAREIFEEDFHVKLKRPWFGKARSTTVNTNKGMVRIFERELKERGLTTTVTTMAKA